MSQPKVHPKFVLELTCPAKVFLLGEYAVLAGRPALVAAVSPRFQSTVSLGEWGATETSGSPLDRFYAWVKAQGLPRLELKAKDPFLGAGGFGASTAEFAMIFLAYTQWNERPTKKAEGEESSLSDFKNDWKAPWNIYQDLVDEEGVSPSGADLVAQWRGGVSYFNPSNESCADLAPAFEGSSLLIFSATQGEGVSTSRKVKTHEHLRSLSQEERFKKSAPWILALERQVEDSVAALEQKDWIKFGKAVDAYADILRRENLEVGATFEDRQSLRHLPGVLGIKGTGALQSDGLIVVMDPKAPSVSVVIEAAQKRGLKLISEGLTYQKGVTCQFRE